MIAAILDSSLISAVVIFTYVKYAQSNRAGSIELPGAYVLILMLIQFLYFPLAEGLTGQTLFKWVLGIKAVSERDRKPSIGTSFKRHLFDFPDFFFFGLIALYVAKRGPDQKRIGDLVAHSVVLLEEEGLQVDSKPIESEPLEESNPFTVQLPPREGLAFRRAISFIIDYSILFICMCCYAILVLGDEGGTIEGWQGGLLFLASWLLVIVIPEGIFGYTLGKAIFRLRVVSEKTDRNLLIVSFIRHLFDLIELILFYGLVSILLIKFNGRHQRIGDIVAGSFVIRDERSNH